MSKQNDKCDRCGKTEKELGWFAAVFRKNELRKGRADPGNLCGACAGENAGKRIAAELVAP